MRRVDAKVVGPYAVALAASALFYFQALQIAPADGQLGADLWPKTILLLAMLTCVWEIVRSVTGSGRASDSTKTNHADQSAVARGNPAESRGDVPSYAPWVGIGLTIAYVTAFPWLGYALSTFLYMAAFVYFGNYRRPVVAFGVALVASLAFMFLFMRVVYVSLPIGVDPFARFSTLLMQAMGVK